MLSLHFFASWTIRCFSFVVTRILITTVRFLLFMDLFLSYVGVPGALPLAVLPWRVLRGNTKPMLATLQDIGFATLQDIGFACIASPLVCDGNDGYDGFILHGENCHSRHCCHVLSAESAVPLQSVWFRSRYCSASEPPHRTCPEVG